MEPKVADVSLLPVGWVKTMREFAGLETDFAWTGDSGFRSRDSGIAESADNEMMDGRLPNP